MSMGQSTGQILGPAAGGLVVAVSSPGIAIAIDAGVAAMFLFGCALAYADTLWMSILQSNVPTHMLSRVASYDYFGTFALRPLGLALVGPLALLVGTNAVLLGNAAVVVAGVAILLSLPKIRHVGIPDIEVIEPESVAAGGT